MGKQRQGSQVNIFARGWAKQLTAFLGACALAASAQASSIVQQPPGCGQNHCDYFTFNSDYAITDIVRFNADNGSLGGLGWSFSAEAGDNLNALAYGSPNGVNNLFFLGLVSNLAGDPSGQEHVVLFTNTAFANSAHSIAWGTLFPNTDEQTLIDDLQNNFAPGTTASDAAIGDLYGFGYNGGDAVTGPNGAISFKPGDHFSIIAFSEGTLIGSGTSVEVSSVPEPQSWALVLGGLGTLVGASVRRKVR